jgi:hypothetical protein
VYEKTQPSTDTFRDYIRLGFRMACRSDNKKFSHEFAFDIQNITNRENPLYMQYNAKKQKTEFVNQLKIFPMMQYRIIF